MTTAAKYKTYPKYKPSGIDWLGDIPEGWEVRRYKNALKIFQGMAFKSSDYVEYSEVISIRMGNIKKGGFIDLEHNIKYLPDNYVQLFKEYILKENDLVIAMTDMSPSLDFLAVPALMKGLDTNFFYLLNQRVGKLIINKQFNTEFLKYLLLSKELRDQLKSLGLGTVQSNMSSDNLYGALFVSPTFPEQQAIAAFLNHETAKIDEMVAKKQKLTELLKEKRQALITHAVTCGLDEKGRLRQKPKCLPASGWKPSGIDWLGDIPDGWEVRRFGFLFSFNKGLSITKENLQDDGIPCVNYGEIHSKYGFEVNPLKNALKCVPDSYLENNQGSKLYFGDFVFADTSEDIEGAGNFTYLNSNEVVFAGYHTIITRPIIQINFRFLAYQFDSVIYRTQIRRSVTGIKVYSITKDILKNSYVLLPPSSEQKSIADFLDRETAKIDEMMKKVESQIEKLQEYRQALISNVVTGKVRV